MSHAAEVIGVHLIEHLLIESKKGGYHYEASRHSRSQRGRDSASRIQQEAQKIARHHAEL